MPVAEILPRRLVSTHGPSRAGARAPSFARENHHSAPARRVRCDARGGQSGKYSFSKIKVTRTHGVTRGLPRAGSAGGRAAGQSQIANVLVRPAARPIRSAVLRSRGLPVVLATEYWVHGMLHQMNWNWPGLKPCLMGLHTTTGGPRPRLRPCPSGPPGNPPW